MSILFQGLIWDSRPFLIITSLGLPPIYECHDLDTLKNMDAFLFIHSVICLFINLICGPGDQSHGITW